MKRLAAKFVQFFLISGLGWILDFSVYTVLTALFSCSVLAANYLSSLPAITFVFFVSTRKTFVCRRDGLSMRGKYVAYVVYQLVLVSLVSFLGQWLFQQLAPLLTMLSPAQCKLLIKVCITPITMICNFFVLRQIAEKW